MKKKYGAIVRTSDREHEHPKMKIDAINIRDAARQVREKFPRHRGFYIEEI